MNRRLLGMSLAGAMAGVLVLSACGGGSGADSADGGDDNDGGGRTIKVVIAEYTKEHTKPFWDDLSQKYEKETGNKVDLQVISWNDIDQQVTQMVQNNAVPDVLNLNAFASYANDGLLYTADEVLSQDTRDDFIDVFAQNGELNGKQYGFPILSSARAFFYNKDLFQQAGITEPPATWDDFVTDAKKITALGNGNIGYALPMGPEEAQAEFSIWMWNNGGDWQSGGDWTIDSDKNVQTLQFLNDLANKEKVTQVDPGKTNRTDGAFKLFQSGKVGMVMGFSPFAATLDKEGKVNYGVAQMPTNVGTSVTLAVEDYLMAFKKNGNQQAVKEFLDMYYDTENIQKFIETEGFLPVTKSGLDKMKSDQALAPYLDALPNAKLVPTVDPRWDKVKIAVQKNIGAGVQPGGDPAKVLGDLQKTAEQTS